MRFHFYESKKVDLSVIVCRAFLLLAGAFVQPQEAKAATTGSNEQNEKVTLVYSWSPHMKLSQKGLAEAKAFAKKHAIKLKVVLDPNASSEFARKVASEIAGSSQSDLKPLDSAHLREEGFLLHYPSYALVIGGEVKGGIVPGYKTEEELTRILKSRGLK